MIKTSIQCRAYDIAGHLDALAREYDYFDYINSMDPGDVEDPAGVVLRTARDILDDPSIISGIMDYLQGIIEDESADDLAGIAGDIMRDLFGLYLDLAPAC